VRVKSMKEFLNYRNGRNEVYVAIEDMVLVIQMGKERFVICKESEYKNGRSAPTNKD